MNIAEGSDTKSDLRYANSTAANPTAYAYYPDGTSRGGDVWFGNNSIMATQEWAITPFVTVIHETGHALGLKHPHEVDGSFGKLRREIRLRRIFGDVYRSYTKASTTTGYVNEEWVTRRAI